MHFQRFNRINKALLSAFIVGSFIFIAGSSFAAEHSQKWMTGDWHQHTFFTDGTNFMGDVKIDNSTTPSTFTILDGSDVTDPNLTAVPGRYKGVIPQGFRYGLDFQANSEHGGNRGSRDGFGRFWSDTNFYPSTASIPLLGTAATYSNTCSYLTVDSPTCGSGSHPVMWRWQELFASEEIKQNSYMSAFDWITVLRAQYPSKEILTGMEWNVPGHEHASTGCLENTGKCIAEFEYRFDQNDTDTDAGPAAAGLTWTGKIQTAAYATPTYPDYSMDLGMNAKHNKTIDGLAWLNAYHPNTSWVNPAHIERAGCGVWNPSTSKWDNGGGASATSVGYSIASIRDMNNAAPTVFFGFEGMPGHQKASNRGEVSATGCGGGTYGGAGTYIATVGGVWDNLLADGRRIFNFVSSDFHMTQDDFYPGEYAKTYVLVKNDSRDGDDEDDREDNARGRTRGENRFTQQDILDGMRSGNSFAVHGDLINELDFKVRSGKESATMGETLHVKKGHKIIVKVRFKDGVTNNNGNVAKVHHVQLIQGRINQTRATKFLADGVTPNPAFNSSDSAVARTVQTFDATSWRTDDEGFTTMSFVVPHVDGDMFFRIRGTNIGYNVVKMDATGAKIVYGTDAEGNPLKNTPGTNNSDMAWDDLWFYSNPIFVKVSW